MSECICGEINSRNCPIHQHNDVTTESKYREFWLTKWNGDSENYTEKVNEDDVHVIEYQAVEELKAEIEFQKQRYYKLDEINTCLNEKITQLKEDLKIAVEALKTTSDYMDNEGQDATYIELVISEIEKKA